MDTSGNIFSRVGLAISMYASSKTASVVGEATGVVAEEDHSFSPIRNSELYPHNNKVVDEDCSPTVQPFPTLSGEALEYIGLLAPDCHIAISNYRFFVAKDDGFYNVPLGLIDAVELYGSKEQLVILCKDGGSFCVVFESQASCHMWQERLRKVIRGARDLDKTFTFVHWAYTKDQQQAATTELPATNGSMLTSLQDQNHHKTSPTASLRAAQPYSSDVVRAEFYRTHMHTGRAWRITDCNCEYKLCSTYPKLLVVPSSLSEEELRGAARFRAMGRIPTVVWRHSVTGAVIVRSSQPLVGVLGWRNSEDEKLLRAISQSCARTSFSSGHTAFRGSSNPVSIPYRNGGPLAQMMDDRGQMTQSAWITNGHSSTTSLFENPPSREDLQDESLSCPELQDRHEAAWPDLLVMDLRSYAAALGNRAKGGGCECTDYYPNCEIVYKNLPNIHSVRKSFQQLRNVLLYDDHSNFLSNLESTQWLHYLCQLVSAACEVVKTVDDRGKPVLVHCSDGWDRTAQVVTLAELMLDPYYRTIEGFQVLIEREWVGFGHRFSDRCGQHAACSDSNQRSPVFLQWLDCVHQLSLQFPCHFQFNINFLVKLGLHSYSCLYGTLLGNSMQERDGVRIGERTLSLWTLLNTDNPDVVNQLYTSTTGHRVLRPVAQLHKMQLWQAMFTTSSLTPSSALADTGSNHRHPTPAGENGEAVHPAIPVEVEMKELVSFGKRRTASDCAHSDSSFASVSSSSPFPQVPLTVDNDEGTKISPQVPGFEGREQQLGESNTSGDLEEKSGNEKLSDEMISGLNSGSQTTPNTSSTASSDSTAIATGSSHMSPTSRTASLPDLSSSPLSGRLLNEMSTDLLHDAMHDHSPQQHKQIPHLNGNLHNNRRPHPHRGHLGGAVGSNITEGCSGGIRLDVDGMSSRCSEADRRLTWILQSYEARIVGLKQELVQVKAALVASVKEERKRLGKGDEGRKEGEEEEEEEAATTGTTIVENNQSPSSLASWDCVEGEEGVGVKWVPDHAATHCQGCATAFSLIVRKHHCRACGGVFCASCTDYMCPVLDEHLYTDVRVCSRCYYRLDGHLVTEQSGHHT